jgi:GT2 family glycosyltransferase
MNIAVLLATFNRKEKTIACLRTLYAQQFPTEVSIDVYLTDDASTDGTRDAIKKEFPQVMIFVGNGSLFWAGGMRNSWQKALNAQPDFYLLLNDDTALENNAIETLLSYYQQKNQHAAICIGTTIDNISGNISYGGRKLINPAKVQSHIVRSDTEFMDCDLGNANIMLVPKEVVATIGILSDDYTHSIADFDYTLRAKKAGFKVIVAPGILGHCVDDHGNNWKSADVSLKDRIKFLKSPKGLAYHEYLKFIKIHFPTHLPEAYFKLWLKTLFPLVWDKLKRN